jgi:iron complex outermembrane receptor protein
VNGALYYYDYKNQQVNTSVRVNGVDLGATTNAAASKIYGLDLDAAAQVTPEFKVNSGLSLLHARYSSYSNALVNVPTVLVAGVDCRCGNTPMSVNASGNPLIRAPDWTLSLTAEYHKEFALGVVDLSATAYHTDKFFFTPDQRVSQPSYTTIESRLAWQPRDSRFLFSVWGRNLTNVVYFNGSFINQVGDGMTYGAPRTVGGTVKYSF